MLEKSIASKSHNGLKWRTLCQPCNGNIVGLWDPALGDMTKQVEALTSSTIGLTGKIKIRVKAGAAIRSLLAHILAAKAQADSVTTDIKMRLFLYGKASLDPDFEIYCWYYPFTPTVIARDFAWVELNGQYTGRADTRGFAGLANVVKFYPIAFMFLDVGAREFAVDTRFMTPLHQFSSLDDITEVDIELFREPLINPHWPERAMGYHALIGGGTWVDAVETITVEASMIPGVTKV